MRAKLLLALHFHQPVGNFDSVFEDAVRLSYRPILEHFERHPKVRAAFHFSGCLLEWLESHDSRLLEQLFRMVSSGQIEPLGGGFYEPILSVIPREDALEQLARMNEYWERRVGVRPRGIWLTERIWEPSLAELLADAGAGYTILDDHHLRLAGFLDSRFSGLFVTERNGKAIGCFPSDFQLRYLIPFRTVPTIREHFEAFRSDDRDWVLTYGDDAEKFGFWPKTYKWVFEERWLDQFLSLLEEPNGPIDARTPGEYFASRPPTTKVYIPNASYTEMLEWALPASSVAEYAKVREVAASKVKPEALDAFVRGSLWDTFLSRYPESDQLHKHVLWTSRRTRAAKGEEAKEARTSVLRAECNCAYWHGLFGGIYLPHLRHGVYSSLLDADARLAERDPELPRVEAFDIDADLQTEVVMLGKKIQAFFRPEDGGTLVELDHLPSRFNLSNVVSRWKESYHYGSDLTHSHEAAAGVASPHEESASIDPRQLESAIFDDRPLRSLRDFVRTDRNLTWGVGSPTRWSTEPSGWNGSYAIGNLTYEKQVSWGKDENVRVNWKLAPETSAGGWFGTLFAFTLLTPDAPDRSLEFETADGEIHTLPPGRATQATEIRRLTFVDRAFGFAAEIRTESPASLSTEPIHTLQRSESRFEQVYQGTLVSLCWPTDRREIEVTIALRSMGEKK